MSENVWSPDDVPLDKPNPARMYDYFLGGFHNFAIDRATAEQVRAIAPDMPFFMRTSRAFLRRSVMFLVEQGIDQFLDLGSGIPTVGNVHEVAQALNPAARVVYVDVEPIAVRHSEAILQGNPNAAVVQADVRQTDLILSHPKTRSLIDFGKPVGVLISNLLHFLTDDEEASTMVRTYRDAVAPGSFLTISHATLDAMKQEVKERGEQVYARTTTPVKLRMRREIEIFFEGLELVEPGFVFVPLWRPEGPDDLLLDQPERSAVYGAVGRKP